MLELDHLVVSAATLAEAVDHCETALGVPLLPGGQHTRFGTHNQLLGVGGSLYLEAISIDPAATPPAGPRWYDLDRRTGPARLSNWACRCADLDRALAGLGRQAGAPLALSRGPLNWRMAVPESGILPFDNLHPALLEWGTDQHPGVTLPDSGCSLTRLIVTHPEARALRTGLQGLLDDPRLVFETGQPALCAEFDTPHGPRVLR